MLKKIEVAFEKMLFASRWLLAPFYLGLVIAVGLLLIKFTQHTYHLCADVMSMSDSDVIIGVLGLIDMSLVANLLIIITFSGYESFVSKLDIDDHEDKPGWMGKIGFAQLKIKLIGSIVAISAVELLKLFMTDFHVTDDNEKTFMWKVIIHITFVVSGVLFAVMDKTSNGGGE